MEDFNRFDMMSDRGQLLVGRFSDFLINRYNIITIDGHIHMYKDGVYVDGEKVIEQAMLEYFPEITQQKRRETLSQIILKAREYDGCDQFKNLIAFSNGVYDIAAEKFKDFSIDYIIPNRIPWPYNPEAYSKDVDAMLNRISCNDDEIRAIIEEMIGYCMYRSLEKGIAFVLVGGASNGKSILQSILIHLLGRKNISSTDLAEFSTDRFATADLYGKLANIADDISGEYISNPSEFKSLTTGEHVRAQRKFGQPFEFDPYATMIFSANRIPRVKDADGGVRRRMKIIPFMRVFKKTDPDYDGGIKTRILYGTDECSAEESMSYLINLGLAGLKRALEDGFTESKKCINAVEEYDKECNPILEWCEEYLEEKETFEGKRREDVYDSYTLWADRSGQKPLSQIMFVKYIKEKYGLEVVPKYHPGIGTKRTFIKKEV